MIREQGSYWAISTATKKNIYIYIYIIYTQMRTHRHVQNIHLENISLVWTIEPFTTTPHVHLVLDSSSYMSTARCWFIFNFASHESIRPNFGHAPILVTLATNLSFSQTWGLQDQVLSVGVVPTFRLQLH